jgi:hypothetical protein
VRLRVQYRVARRWPRSSWAGYRVSVPTLDDIMRSVADSEDSAYAFSSDFRIVRVNAGFARFARENGGGTLADEWYGRSVIDAMAAVLRPFYVAAFENAWATGQPWEHEYECSGPQTYRRFRLIAYPMERALMAAIHSRTVEMAHDRPLCAPDARTYEVDGFIRMCSHCRRVHNPRAGERWDWVPDYLSPGTRNVSHGLCKPCAEFYWSGAG